MKLSVRLLLAALTVAALLVPDVQAQLLRKGKDNQPAPTPATQPAVTPATPAPGETAGQTRREGREEAREARQETRAAGEGRLDARDAARETRQATRQNIQATRAADLGLWVTARGNEGLMISDLENQSLFANAGFREGDIIVSVNGQRVAAEAQFMQFLIGPNVGTQPIQVVVLRDGQQQTLVLQPATIQQTVVEYDPLYQYGIVIDDRNPNQIIVQRVYPRTPAYYAGLRAGDVISTIGGQRIANVTAFTQALTQADGNLALQVNRGGRTRDIQLDAATDSNVRTALRPNFDADARAGANIDGRAGARAEGRADVNTPPARNPDSDAAQPRTPDSARAPARTPDSAAPRTDTTPRASTPNQPQAAPPAAPGTTPAAPGAPRATAPATPATPAAPATPATPRAQPATPATPATPAAPKAPATPKAPAAPGAPATPPASPGVPK